MKTRNLTAICIISAIGAYSSVAAADQNYSDQRWAPQQSGNDHWQAPNWSNFNQQPAHRSPPPQAPTQIPSQQRYNNYNQEPAAQNNRPPQQSYNQPMHRPAPNANSNVYRAYPSQSQYGSYRGPGQSYGPSYGPDNGASAYNTPGYNRYQGNRRNNNNFWGRSGPSTWMNPNKNSMERGWDDMINSPSRMGEMPGGWNAPEVSMPNPVDMGDQMQDNVKDLPDQMRDMDVGN